MYIERNYGIDTLKIISMFMVVVLHVLGRGGILNATKELSINYSLAWFLEISSFCAVNCYAIISGYVGYGRKIKYSSLIYLCFCVIFYILLITFSVKIFVPAISFGELTKSFFHIRTDGYWYVKAYFCAFFFFPHINYLVENYNKKTLYIFAGVLFVLFSIIPTLNMKDTFSTMDGYSPLWLIIMYFFGAVIRKYDFKKDERKNNYLLLYLFMIILTFISVIGIAYLTKRIYKYIFWEKLLVSYISPTIVFSAVFLVKYFSNIKLNKLTIKIVSVISPLTFGIYIIHTQYFFWKFLENKFAGYAEMNPFCLVVSIILTACAIYTSCAFIDYVRRYIFKFIRIKEIAEKIEMKMRDLKDSIFDKIFG